MRTCRKRTPTAATVSYNPLIAGKFVVCELSLPHPISLVNRACRWPLPAPVPFCFGLDAEHSPTFAKYFFWCGRNCRRFASLLVRGSGVVIGRGAPLINNKRRNQIMRGIKP